MIICGVFFATKKVSKLGFPFHSISQGKIGETPKRTNIERSKDNHIHLRCTGAWHAPMARECMGLVQAIIVDAFCEVKESACASVSILDDLKHTLRARAANTCTLASSVFWWRPRTSLTTTETGKLLKYACTRTAACSGDTRPHLHTQPSQLE